MAHARGEDHTRHRSHAVFLAFEPDHGELGDLSRFGFRRDPVGAPAAQA